MVSKESILHLLEKQLDNFTKGYIDEIYKLDNQLTQLNETITKLSNENLILKSKVIEKEVIALDFKDKYETLLQSQNQLSEDVSYQLIDKWCVSNSINDSTALLSALNYLLEDEKKLDKATYIIQLLQHNPAPLMHGDQSIQDLFKKSLSKILTSELYILGEKDPNELYKSYLGLLVALNITCLKPVIFEFFRQNFNDIVDVIFYLKTPNIFVVFLKVCHRYNLSTEVAFLLHHILGKEWEAFDTIISKEEYVVLLHYAFLFDLDGLLIEKSSESLQWLDESIQDLSLYFYLYDCINEKEIPTGENYQNNIQKFSHGMILSDFEKEQIVEKMDRIMTPLFVNKKGIQKAEILSFGVDGAASEGANKGEKLRSQDLLVSERIQRSLDLLETFFLEERFDYIERILNDLHSDLHHFGKKDRERLLSFILQIFNMNYEDVIDLDNLHKVVMSIIQQMSDTHDAEMFLHNHNEIISERVLDLNDPYLISELAVSYFQFNLTTILGIYLNKVIDQWSFIDANIDERSFIRLFWITFNQRLDKRLIKVLDKSVSFLKIDIPEAKLYSVYQDPILDPVSKRVEIEGLKRKVNYFAVEETKRIFLLLDNRIKKMIMKANTNKLRNENVHDNYAPSVVRKMMYVVKLPTESPFIPGTKNTLTEEWVELAVFADVFLKSQPKYVVVKVLSQNYSGKVFVTSALLQEIKSLIGRKKFIDVHSFEEKVNVVKNNKDEKFQWPGTEIIGNGTSDQNENSLLNEVSELKKIGYQITGLTREKRWLLLEKAVKQLGLKKVAFTIAQNVKLRKGQKNGERKFSYAISEWEYDLSKLKKHYYKNEFTWPSTKVKN